MKPAEQQVYERLPAYTSALFDVQRMLAGLPLETMLAMANRVLLTGKHTAGGQTSTIEPEHTEQAMALIRGAIAMRDCAGDLGEQGVILPG